MHLLFNMMWLYYLGGEIEARRGSLRLLALVLAVAVVSNLAQYGLGGLTWQGGHFARQFAGRFGGMSGVVFGLFGYVWMKMRFEPELGLGLSQQTFVLTLIWFVFCFTGLAGPVANFAHAAGLAVGMAAGAAPALWRRLRRR
jgi:membrane associated rhomboid family serine protease